MKWGLNKPQSKLNARMRVMEGGGLAQQSAKEHPGENKVTASQIVFP